MNESQFQPILRAEIEDGILALLAQGMRPIVAAIAAVLHVPPIARRKVLQDLRRYQRPP